MAQPPHFEIEGTIYFVTSRVNNMSHELSPVEASIVEQTIHESKNIGEIKLYAYIIMPDHFHILLKPVTYGVSKTVQLIKGRASRIINKGKFWQKAFLTLW